MVSGRQKGSLTLPTAQLVASWERGLTPTSETESRKKMRCTQTLLGGDDLSVDIRLKKDHSASRARARSSGQRVPLDKEKLIDHALEVDC